MKNKQTNKQKEKTNKTNFILSRLDILESASIAVFALSLKLKDRRFAELLACIRPVVTRQ